ncbi:Aromatic-ring hydroxylase-like protein [Metarhizium album ARSEF 1941]|uniref:Aromatic-ring hydroxylase-like protein n=1 Tax=Metarhizium album (strain ARSEF 1941) TaxID=1081103 RepID=A0A0B2WYM6_METAS|nr:Aromatic-ring hydroxylase-like protein [Metarhizium album ARSEF 1941]KHN98679.1 Aromatic-ring hydroxylase-like protein [Metarhizium album ARSEF 1941]
MKIIIVGAGISGCAVYLQLRKHLPKPPSGEAHKITIYEAYDTNVDTTSDDRGYGPTHSSTLIVGGGLGVAANGLGVLQRLDEDLLRDIVRDGYSCATMNMKSKSGKVLARMQPAGKPALDGQGQDTMNTVACSRHALWRQLRRRIPDDVIVTKRVSEVVARSDGLNVVSFVDGSPSAEADLVIGADGLKGLAKKAIFAGDGDGDTTDPFPPHYEGLCGVGGFVPFSLVKDHVEIGSMNFVMGGNGFFGYFIAESAPDAPHRDSAHHVSPPGESVGWWSTYSVDKCPDPKSVRKEDILEQLRLRHRDWDDPVIRKVLETSKVTCMYPTWVVPPLPTWERDGVVLVGDAAHALPSTSGQGASQALEDVECFALFLSHHLGEAYESNAGDSIDHKYIIKTAAKQYLHLRQPRVKGILDHAQNWQDCKRDKTVIEEYIMYAWMWAIGRASPGSSRAHSTLICASQELYDYPRTQLFPHSNFLGGGHVISRTSVPLTGYTAGLGPSGGVAPSWTTTHGNSLSRGSVVPCRPLVGKLVVLKIHSIVLRDFSRESWGAPGLLVRGREEDRCAATAVRRRRWHYHGRIHVRSLCLDEI